MRQARLIRRREVVAWVLFGLAVAACVFTFLASVHERKTQMELSDMLETRLYQNVNDAAAVQAAAGVGATASVDGNDAVGQVNITTGSHTSTGSLVHITFNKPYGTQPFVMLTPEDQPPPPNWYVTIDQNGWDIVVGTPPKPGTNYPFAYFIAPRPWLMYLTATK
jgi:hypothetical protein